LDPVFALRFNTVINLVYLERYAAAAAGCPPSASWQSSRAGSSTSSA